MYTGNAEEIVIEIEGTDGVDQTDVTVMMIEIVVVTVTMITTITMTMTTMMYVNELVFKISYKSCPQSITRFDCVTVRVYL